MKGCEPNPRASSAQRFVLRGWSGHASASCGHHQPKRLIMRTSSFPMPRRSTAVQCLVPAVQAMLANLVKYRTRNLPSNCPGEINNTLLAWNAAHATRPTSAMACLAVFTHYGKAPQALRKESGLQVIMDNALLPVRHRMRSCSCLTRNHHNKTNVLDTRGHTKNTDDDENNSNTSDETCPAIRRSCAISGAEGPKGSHVRSR